MAYDGSERECFYVAEDTLANQNFQYVTDVSFADEERGIAALVFQSSEDSKDCYVAKVDARTNKASLYKMEHGLEMALGVDGKVETKADCHQIPDQQHRKRIDTDEYDGRAHEGGYLFDISNASVC